MRYLILSTIFLISCGHPEKKQIKENYVEDSEIQEIKEDFIELVESYNEYYENVEIKFSNDDNIKYASCRKIDEKNVVLINSNFWNKEGLPEDHKYYKEYKLFRKLVVFGSLAPCSLMRRAVDYRVLKTDHVVPVPYSLTYPNGVTSSLLIQRCYEDDMINVYTTDGECKPGYENGINLRKEYFHELITGDNSGILKKVNDWNDEMQLKKDVNYCKRYFYIEKERCPYPDAKEFLGWN